MSRRKLGTMGILLSPSGYSEHSVCKHHRHHLRDAAVGR